MQSKNNKLTGIWSESEGLIIVKMSISSNARGWGEGMGKSAIRAIKGVEITMFCLQEHIHSQVLQTK